MNKRALEDSLFVWIGVIFVIAAFYGFIYTPGILIMFGEKSLSRETEVVVNGGGYSETVESFLNFLESERGSGIKVKDFAESDMNKFKELIKEFFDYSVKAEYGRAWIRIYEKESRITKEDGFEYEVGKSENSQGFMTGNKINNCNPEKFLFLVFLNNKKIAMCLE